MIFRRFSLAILCFFVALPMSVAAAAGAKSPGRAVETAYKGAIVMDASTGNILFEDRADIVSPPASMTKLMTFAVLHDKIAAGTLTLQTPVTVSAADSRIGGTQVWLKEKAVFPVEELIHAMMIQSANDAAHALARAAAGSTAVFVDLMNAKARELGMEKTQFRTPHGLPPSNRNLAEGDLTSPRDFALLSRYLLQKTDALKYTAIVSRTFDSSIVMRNHNNLLGRVAGVDGLKTGFTNGAGFCLAATAHRDQRHVIVVVMGSPSAQIRDVKVTQLLEQGFAALPASTPIIGLETEAVPITAAPAPVAKTTSAPATDDPPPIKVNLPRTKKK